MSLSVSLLVPDVMFLPLQIASVTPISLYNEPCVSAANPSGFAVAFPLVEFMLEM